MIVTTLFVGAVVGILVTLLTENHRGLVSSIAIGIAGTLFGRWVFVRIFGIHSTQSAGSLSFGGIFWGVVGALIILAVLGLFQRHHAISRN